ncbi:hypothetical protein M406DRAFT_268439 [Cryphonectria parasitica EP155]|uniref:TPR domain-containing protein n=1 Tax=Cryphonectria parasitica (strain ATCC 38755 / EP155) TaxID=660469 RepID=A0A9P5CK12_CRYP1|nr:uncharacterized protein M406DRAFT_268439 [Cryphonectria parasitica EP155]KAF3760476.1 hypothetical protein M406DRAFT_268439 [Cryphonectria parasitica EP155]
MLRAGIRPSTLLIRRSTAYTRALKALPSSTPYHGLPDARGSLVQDQTRWITSDSRRPQPSGQPNKQKEAFWQTLRRALRFSSIFRGQSLRKLFRESPEETVLAVLLLLATSGAVAYAVYMYFNYFYAEQFTRYPPDVAKSLRRALYYSNHQPDPKLALKYYRLALEQCTAHGLDPFSNDVIGIKIQLAAWLEKMGNIPGAIRVLDLVLSENKKWLSLVETSPERLPGAPRPGPIVGDDQSAQSITQEDFEQWVRSSRARVLLKSCQISVKLGTLYAEEHVLDNDKSHEHLMWAVETALTEFQRRASDGTKDGEGSWLTPEEIGGALESLGNSYERKGQFDLALPLFFQALRLCRDQCHLAVIMNNLAASFAQHPPRPPYETLAGIVPGQDGKESPTPAASGQTWTRKEHLESAARWAKNALKHAKEPTGEARTPECDQACAVALVNLGDIAMMSGDYNVARRKYERAIQVSEENSFAEGVKQAQAGLARLSQ